MSIKNNYPPPYLDNKTVAVLSDVQQQQLDAIQDKINQIFKNNFVNTADLTGVENFERMLNIFAYPSETLEYRKIRIVARLTQTPPFTRLFLLSFLDLIFGINQYRLTFPSRFRILIRVSNIPNARFLEGLAEIRRFITSNVVIDIRELRRTWGEVKEEYTTWGQPFTLTEWNFRGEESWNSTPSYSWGDRYRIVDPSNGGVKGLSPTFNSWDDATILKIDEVDYDRI